MFYKLIAVHAAGRVHYICVFHQSSDHQPVNVGLHVQSTVKHTNLI